MKLTPLRLESPRDKHRWLWWLYPRAARIFRALELPFRWSDS